MHEQVPISRRVQSIKISATKRMPMLAAARGGCVSLGQGVPSFPTPEHILRSVFERLQNDPACGRYSLQPGMTELRRALAEMLSRDKGVPADPETEVAVTVGAMEGLLMAMLTLVDAGDEVLLPSPCYPSHVEQVLLAEGKPVFVPCDPKDWSLDPGELRRRITPRTRALVLCNPSNPTGAVLPDSRVREIVSLAAEHGLVILADETYDSLVYDGPPPLSPASLRQACVITVGSFSKKYALTGWRVGFVHAPAPLLDQMLKVHDCTAICAPAPAQLAALAALQGPQQVVEDMRRTLGRRRDLACERLDRLAPDLDYVRPSGAFYVMARYAFSPEDSMTLALRLLREAGVVTIPGGSFGPGGESHLRLSFGGSEEELTEAFDRLETWLEKEHGRDKR